MANCRNFQQWYSTHSVIIIVRNGYCYSMMTSCQLDATEQIPINF